MKKNMKAIFLIGLFCALSQTAESTNIVLLQEELRGNIEEAKWPVIELETFNGSRSLYKAGGTFYGASCSGQITYYIVNSNLGVAVAYNAQKVWPDEHKGNIAERKNLMEAIRAISQSGNALETQGMTDQLLPTRAWIFGVSRDIEHFTLPLKGRALRNEQFNRIAEEIAQRFVELDMNPRGGGEE